MDQGVEGSRSGSGGIISLAKMALEHREALEYDLLTKTGHEIEDIGRSLSWRALMSFVKKLDGTSAMCRDTNPEAAEWSSTIKTNFILADIYDVLAAINANLTAIGSGRRAKQPKQYPRPNKNKNENEKHIGSGALPAAELHEWIERKRAEHGRRRSSTGDNNSHTGPVRGPAENN